MGSKSSGEADGKVRENAWSFVGKRVERIPFSFSLDEALISHSAFPRFPWCSSNTLAAWIRERFSRRNADSAPAWREKLSILERPNFRKCGLLNIVAKFRLTRNGRWKKFSTVENFVSCILHSYHDRQKMQWQCAHSAFSTHSECDSCVRRGPRKKPSSPGPFCWKSRCYN